MRFCRRRGLGETEVTRREVLRAGFTGLGLFVVGPTLMGCGDGDGSDGSGSTRTSNIANLGPLGEPDENGVRLPAGFRSRIIGRSRQKPIPTVDFNWHLAPDGGATYPTDDGGWIYVSNSEVPIQGGVNAVRFDADGNLVDFYPILTGTSINCAGGPTPWGTWLTCEEFNQGHVWECDPYGVEPAVMRPTLGRFQHEAVCVDTDHQHLFLTEDVSDGRFYRFRPDRLIAGNPDLSSGTLEVAEVTGGGETGPVVWHALANPTPSLEETSTREQVPQSTPFRGGEGIWFREGIVYFATKGDHRIWAYDTHAETVDILYDDSNYESPILRGVDNIVATDSGDVLVAEDGDDMQIVAITPSGLIVPILQVVGHDGSEITGPAFNPAGDRLYFSSQRGTRNHFGDGYTFEVTGPFYL
ncbi:MAG TPA: alkaline phosphatase PhoX [Terriglobales bacterium]|nr:alkaline phosphatase PhoX [Terriglobales bacterium]